MTPAQHGFADDLDSDIREQPDALARFLDAEAEHADDIAKKVHPEDIRYVVVAGRGSSDNAARYAQYLFGAERRLPVALATPSLFTRYGMAPRLDGALVVAVSQSGRSHDVVEVVTEARRQGRPTIGITNTPDSPLAEAVEHVMSLHAGEERAAAATKTYTCSLAAFALLSAALDRDNSLREELFRLPEVLAATLAQADAYRRAADAFAEVPRTSVIGRGFNLATAHEIALKLTALTHTAGQSYSAADLITGPVAVAGDGPVVLVAPSGRVLSDVVDLIPRLRPRFRSLATISDVPEVLDEADVPLPLPGGVREWLSPIAAVVPGQLLALEVARRQGTIDGAPA